MTYLVVFFMDGEIRTKTVKGVCTITFVHDNLALSDPCGHVLAMFKYDTWFYLESFLNE